MSQEEKFGPSVRRIEENIITLMSQTPLFMTRDIATSKILMYFITRKELTQKNLRELTDLSKGKISQEVNKLIDQNLISIKERSSTGQITYIMDSIDTLTNTRALNMINNLLSWDERLNKLKKEMEEEQADLKNLNGYDKVKSLVDFYYNVIGKIKKNKDKWYFKPNKRI